MKIISVPLTVEAMQRLDTDSCIEGDLKEVELNKVEYAQLWESGVFERLNNDLGIMIEDYEDEVIPADNLQEGIEIVEEYHNNNNALFRALLELFKLALERKTGVFFFF